MSRIHSLIAFACLVIFVGLAAYASEQEATFMKQGNFGTMPPISYSDAEGKLVSPDFKAHKLTALHFWATWCVPCVDELPQLDDAQDIFGKELQIIPISMDGKQVAKVQKFFKDHKIEHLPVLLDPTNKTSQIAELKGLPGTLFVDAKGRIVARADGPLDWQQEEVEQFLKTRLK